MQIVRRSVEPPPMPPVSRVEVVQRISDGDSLVLESGEKVRLCGIDAPEQKQKFGAEATALLRSLVLGKRVYINPIETDRYGRLVAEVFIAAPTPEQPEQEKFINGEMVHAGMAYHYPRYSGTCPNKTAIVNAESEAKSKKLGVWKLANAVKPWDYRKQ